MTKDNILCGRKLEFGDIYQIENRKELNGKIDEFLQDKHKNCWDESRRDIDDCEMCPCKCYSYQEIQKTIEFYKTKGTVVVGKIKDYKI